jgi:hypothetical protein
LHSSEGKAAVEVKAANRVKAVIEVSKPLARCQGCVETAVKMLSDNQVTVACATLGKLCQISLLPLRTEQLQQHQRSMQSTF